MAQIEMEIQIQIHNPKLLLIWRKINRQNARSSFERTSGSFLVGSFGMWAINVRS